MSRSVKLIIACTAGLLLLMISTQPGRLPSIMLILPFLLVFVVLVLLCIRVFRWQGLPQGKSIRLGFIGATLPVLLLVLQSLGQLTIRDFLTILALFVITYFYLSRVTRPSRE